MYSSNRSGYFKYFTSTAIACTLFAILSQSRQALVFAAPSLVAKSAARNRTATATIPGWKMIQNSYLAGQHEVFLSKQGIRIVNLGTKLVVVAKAPEWNVFCISDAKKSFCPVKIGRLNQELNFTNAFFGGPVYNDIPLVPAKGISTRKDIKVTSYESTPAYDTQQLKLVKSREVSPNTPIQIKYEVWKSDLPSVEQSVMSILYGTPAMAGIPIMLSAKNQNYNSHVELSTEYVEPGNFQPAIFDVPADYKKVSAVEALRPPPTTDFPGVDVVPARRQRNQQF